MTVSLTTAPGDLLVAAISVSAPAAPSVVSVTDSAGNNWTRIGSWGGATGQLDGELWYASGTAAVRGVTARVTGLGTVAMEVAEFSGATALDTRTGSSGTGPTADSGSVTPQSVDEVAVGFVAGGGTRPAVVNQSAYTSFPAQSAQSSGSPVSLTMAFSQLGGSTGSQSVSAGMGGSVPWTAGIATFRLPTPKATAASDLASIVNQVSSATHRRYGVKDSVGNSMDTAKIVPDPQGGYLAVYHTLEPDGLFHVNVATSSDLMHWTHRNSLDSDASQPCLYFLSDGSALMADEKANGPDHFVRIVHYPSVSALLSGAPDRSFDGPNDLSHLEGTPSIYSAAIYPDLDHSVIDIGLHYNNSLGYDRQARAELTDWASWTDVAESQIDTAVQGAGAQGMIGDRDNVWFEGADLNLQEGQLQAGNNSSWRIFEYDWANPGKATRLGIRTNGGSKSFGNPTMTLLTAPDGHPALVVTLFVFSGGATPGEAGELIYYKDIG